MVKCWIFSSRSRGNIRRAAERLLWGFWDKELVVEREELEECKSARKSKLAENWRQFLRLYSDIQEGDIVFLQMARTGEMHAVGIVKDKHYDDQTPIWDQELKNNKVLFPWRVSFYFMIYSEKPFARLFIKSKEYVKGYGIGEISFHEAKELLDRLKEEYGLIVNASFK